MLPIYGKTGTQEQLERPLLSSGLVLEGHSILRTAAGGVPAVVRFHFDGAVSGDGLLLQPHPG